MNFYKFFHYSNVITQIIYVILLNFSQFLRLVNIIHLSTLSPQRIWEIVKRVRSENIVHNSCLELDDAENKIVGSSIRSLLDHLEKEINVNKSEHIFDNVTNAKLKQAGEMFVYLAYCHDIANDWFKFYEQLFHDHTLNQIILALNKISKVRTITYPSKFVKINDIERKILEKIENLFALQFKNITKGIDSTIRRKEMSDIVTG